MNVKEEKICRLCLKVVENDFEIIDETKRKISEVVLLGVNLDISEDSIICKDCAQVMEKCFNFKSMCKNTEEIISSCAINKNEATFELGDVFKDGNDIETVVDNFICRLCCHRLSGNNFVLLDTLMDDIAFAEKLQKFMSDTDFEIIKNPVICTSCRQNLECYIKFVENCCDVEEKISKYFQSESTSPYTQVNFSEILQDTKKNILELDHSLMHEIKQEDVSENIVEVQSEVYDDESFKYKEALDIKGAVNNTEPLIFKCTMCTYRTKQKGNLKRHMLIHKDVTEVEMHKCPMCTYQAKRKANITRHMLIHKDINKVEIHKCLICIYETKYNGDLKRHMLNHKASTEVEMFQCSMCTYATKHKGHLKTHMLVHKDIKELVMHKCSMCAYETKQKCQINRHIMLVHKDIAEVEMYKCSMCIYVTKQKAHLERHMLIHKDITEVTMYKCSMCVYETKYKESLTVHMLIHKDVREVEMYRCSQCTYKTKHKGGLRSHTLIHRDITEVGMFKCSRCTYETKRKSNLKSHMLVHRHYGAGKV